MSVQRIASRYAKSLIELANEQGQLEPVTEDMHSLKALLDNRDLFLLFKSPVVPTEKKKQIFNLLFKDQLSAMTGGFLNILTTKGREAYMPDIVEEYIKQYKRLKHISTVKLTTAVELDDKMIQSIHDKLIESGATDDKVEITSFVDPDLVGGFVLEFDDKIYDASISNKLDELKRQFRDNVYVSQIVAR